MASTLELDDAVYAELKGYCARGDVLAKEHDFPAALKQYWLAWDLLPEPKTEWGRPHGFWLLLETPTSYPETSKPGATIWARPCTARKLLAIPFSICALVSATLSSVLWIVLQTS